jgi:DNA primase
MNRWLNFRHIKDTVPLGMVLQSYGWKCSRRCGDRVQGRCPIHRGQRADAFHADLRQNGFHCFVCQAHGSVLDLVAAVERCSLRQAALRLAERFGVEPWVPQSESDVGRPPTAERIREKESSAALRFALGPIDGTHAYLQERGIEVDTAAHFGVGFYAGPGLLQGRVVIPIHNQHGQLLAYAGRSIDGAAPKYKLPAGFAKSRVLFNLHCAATHGIDRVIVVEGFFDCLKMHQAGFPCVVGLMGCSLSAHQEALLVERYRNVTLMLDGDPAGQQGSRLIADRLRPQCAVDIAKLVRGQQPDQLTTPEILRALSGTTAARDASKS